MSELSKVADQYIENLKEENAKLRNQLDFMTEECKNMETKLEMAKHDIHRLSNYDCGLLANSIVRDLIAKLK
jgi:hypothetical protein